jgi:peptidoglycan/LPS O-acetylase OafA/YrhL
VPGPLANAAWHVSFLFGFIPDGGGPTGMPDWSIGLEMQFYAAFPLLAWLLWRRGPEWLCALAAVACVISWRLWGVYSPDQVGPLGKFLQPSFLPLMLPMFTIGMTTAWLWWTHPQGGARWALAAGVAALGAVAFEHGHSFFSLGLIAVALAFRALRPTRSLLDATLAWCNARSDRPWWKWMAELSYTLYLGHAMAIDWLRPPILALGLGRVPSFLLLCTLVALVSYALAWLMHLTVEKPMVRWARRWV